MGVCFHLVEAPGDISDNTLDKAIEMDVTSEEHEPPIHSLEVTWDEASMSTTIGDISLLDRSVIYWAPPF